MSTLRDFICFYSEQLVLGSRPSVHCVVIVPDAVLSMLHSPNKFIFDQITTQ